MSTRYLTASTVALLLPLLALLAPGAAAQCTKTFGPTGPELRPEQVFGGDQTGCQVVRGTNAITFAWSSGGDVLLRRFNLYLAPTGPEQRVNSFFTAGVQDEPVLSEGASGHWIVVWTDRFGYDGSGSGIMARIYAADETSVTSEFVVNSITVAGQAEPRVAPTPSGGWAITWTGDADRNVYLRVLDENGVFLSGDVPVNAYTDATQRDSSPAVNPAGRIFVAFVDYSGHGATGTNLYARSFNSAGVPFESEEFELNSTLTAGNQLQPRVAADDLGRFILVFEDAGGDGSGSGIFERVFDENALPLALEAQVNTVTTGNQTSPCIAVDSIGRQSIAWVDESAGAGLSVIRSRHMNAQANPFGPDFQLSEGPLNGLSRPSVSVDATGADMVFGYQGPGAIGQGVDVIGRRYAWTSGPQVYCSPKVNSQGCLPSIGWSGTPSATSQAPFTILGTNLLNRKLVLLFYGYGSAFTPFQGSTICVAPPLKRLAPMNTGGNIGTHDCSGAPSIDFNARIRSGVDAGLVSGATISARWYYRDPLDPSGFATGLTDALRFVICP